MTEQKTATQSQELQHRMAIQYEVDQALNKIISDMRGLVDDTKIAQSFMEKNQMSNLLAVALETPSVELVKTFILYQVGRDTGSKNWRYENFGEALVKRLDKLNEDAKSIANAVRKTIPLLGTPDVTEIEAIWMDLVRQYLGQLNRYFYYRKEVK
ncbi:MAG TPA: hypothetical protein VGD99_29785 [Anaerolineae bacterium]